ncbi:MAG TPA: shikimate kinase [Candidatus Fimadaptatus faecigallinarum]|uniref:Shikimate kinase n=1 Tax=Candidatus Fimadaptatus faecigallinarum TaxID=2840814 RepID=A0A9D1LSH2_9FIRM|nr:shikimate kinase [Candidatus Fimadaptatus faecigallinarum]
MNIILIGMPGAGKSTLGVLLAKLMGYMFVDTDILLQQKHGALLGRILRRNGNRAFLKLEEEMFLSLELDGAVIATGGSAIYSEAGMAHMKRTGPCVFLNVPYELIASRLGNLRQRGVVLPNGYTLRDLYDERLPLYRKFADITVDLDKPGSLDVAAKAVFDQIRARYPDAFSQDVPDAADGTQNCD